MMSVQLFAKMDPIAEAGGDVHVYYRPPRSLPAHV